MSDLKDYEYQLSNHIEEGRNTEGWDIKEAIHQLSSHLHAQHLIDEYLDYAKTALKNDKAMMSNREVRDLLMQPGSKILNGMSVNEAGSFVVVKDTSKHVYAIDEATNKVDRDITKNAKEELEFIAPYKKAFAEHIKENKHQAATDIQTTINAMSKHPAGDYGSTMEHFLDYVRSQLIEDPNLSKEAQSLLQNPDVKIFPLTSEDPTTGHRLIMCLHATNGLYVIDEVTGKLFHAKHVELQPGSTKSKSIG